MDFDIKVGGEPPESARGGTKGKYAPIADTARRNPGEWIHVDKINRNVAGAIRAGEIKGFKGDPGTWDVKISGVDNETKLGTLWVRYQPPEKEA